MSTRLHQAVFTKLNQRILLTSGLVLLILYVGGDVLKLKWIKPTVWYATSVPAIAVGVNVYARLREQEEEDKAVSFSTQSDEDSIQDNPFNYEAVIQEIDADLFSSTPTQGLLPSGLPSGLPSSLADPRMMLLQQAALLPPEDMVRFVEAAAKLVPDTHNPKVLPSTQSPSTQSQEIKHEISSRPKRTGQKPAPQPMSQPVSQSTTQSTSQSTSQENPTKPSAGTSTSGGRVVELFPSDPWDEEESVSTSTAKSASINEFFPDPVETSKGSGNSRSNGNYSSSDYSGGSVWIG